LFKEPKKRLLERAPGTNRASIWDTKAAPPPPEQQQQS
jgi:hypothetical protein